MLGKLAGALIIVGATSFLGWIKASGYARRPRHLRDLQTGLAVLQTEVEYGATPLPEALESAARAAGAAVGPIFAQTARQMREGGGSTAGDSLRRALEAAADSTALTGSDLDMLAALAPVLGASGRADQVRHLTLARERLAGEEARAQDERKRYEPVARYAGVLLGAVLALISM